MHLLNRSSHYPKSRVTVKGGGGRARRKARSNAAGVTKRSVMVPKVWVQQMVRFVVCGWPLFGPTHPRATGSSGGTGGWFLWVQSLLGIFEEQSSLPGMSRRGGSSLCPTSVSGGWCEGPWPAPCTGAGSLWGQPRPSLWPHQLSASLTPYFSHSPRTLFSFLCFVTVTYTEHEVLHFHPVLHIMFQ